MVMAGNDNVSGSALDEPLSARLQWLQQRREALQEKLLLKNAELTNLCIKEAELTGILPAEIPLEPGQSPPSFRRRVGTAYTYPQNLINKLKNSEAEESALELERHVQVGIAEAALGIFNNPTESKAVRRKQRLVYQQSQRRLQELETRLNFVRQAHGKARRATQIPQVSGYATQPHPQAHVKHRTKKPRPPLDSAGNDRSSKSTRSLLQEGGISLSPLGPENNYNTYPGPGYQDTERSLVPGVTKAYNQNHVLHSTPSPVTRRQSPKLLEHDHNDNHNIYILPDQHRARTYSHGSGGSRNANHYLDVERNYRPVPNTYTEQERLARYRQLQQQQQQQHHQQQLHNHQQYPDYRNSEDSKTHIPTIIPQFYYDAESHPRRYVDTPDYQSSYQTQSQSLLRRETNNRTSRSNGPPSDPHQPPGYWIRYEDDIIWCPDDHNGDKFGSLDRRKRHDATQVANSAGTEPQQSRYHTVAGSKSTSLLPRHHVPTNPQPTEQPATSRMLLRTQSLGSVETWHSGNSAHSQDSQDKDTTDDMGRKGKEKGWYETSLDSSPSAITINSHRPLTAVSSLSMKTQSGISASVLSENSSRSREILPEERLIHPQSRYHQPPKLLEIPAESKPLDNGNVGSGPLESPKNCTIVQAGKYQPYREVTKPFEMSDFYKYSTKYRKRTENIQATSPTIPSTIVPTTTKLPQDPRIHMMVQMSQELRLENGDDRGLASPVQKRIYQPSRRMTCQPCNPARTEDNCDEWYTSEKEVTASATLV